MERRVKFTTVTKFEISDEDFKSLYTLMALVKYPYDCDPDYKDNTLIRRLCNDFRRFNVEMIKVCEADKNNLVLSQLRNYIQRHYGFLKKMSKQADNDTQ